MRGYILIASLAAMAVLSTLGYVMVQDRMQESRQEAAELAGTMGAQFKQALRALIAREGTGLPTGTFTGVNWLKDSGSCAGATGSARYLPCEFPALLPLGLSYRTVVTSAAGVVTATVTFGTPSVGGNTHPTLAGRVVSAINGTSADYSTPATQTYYAATNDVATGAISMVVSNSQENLEFVKVDGTSTITADHDWNNFSISNLRNLSVNGAVAAATVSATSINATSINAESVTTSRTIDRDNNGYYVDPNGISVGNIQRLNQLQILSSSVAGTSCLTGSIGRTSTGEPLSCVNGQWAKPSASIDVGNKVSVSFNQNYCPGKSAVVYAEIRGDRRDSMGVQIDVNGSLDSRSRQDSEGWMGYHSVTTIIAAGDCFRVRYITIAASSKRAWYRTL
tara:strand:- start:326 stop:1507 length:1182 start_codon:yes stop_codon:yes gene_type:complete